MTNSRQTVTATHLDIIKAHLMKGATTSKWESYERYQITCLAQRIYDLRKAGLKIQGKSVTKNGKRFEIYWIEEEDRAKYVSDQVNVPADAQRIGDNIAIEDGSTLDCVDEATKAHRVSRETLAAVGVTH